MLLKVPFLATVDRLVDDRGFGFARCERTADEYFFHISADLSGQRDFTGLTAGELLLCQLGTRLKEPGRPCIVQWVRVTDFDWNDHATPTCQSDLDGMRRDAMRGRTLNQLHQHLEAKWYVKQWGGQAPADLSDPVLGEVWLGQLSKLDPQQLEMAKVGERLQTCRFDFRERIDTTSPRCSVVDLLTTFSALQLSVLGPPQKKWLDRSWTQKRQAADFLLPTERKSGTLDHGEKAAVLEWFLLRSIAVDLERIDEGWLPGIHPYEATTAQRLLDRADPLPAKLRQWIVDLASKGLIARAPIERLAFEDPFVAVQVFKTLSADEQRRIRAGWVVNPEPFEHAIEVRPESALDIALRCVLAVDLETDGERIWEIGCARHDVSACLHDEKQNTDIAVALNELAGLIKDSALIIGHNILAWDWPILATRLSPGAEPLIWDTLLVQYLLEPQAVSHALGGKHNAEADAQAALALFAKQLESLPVNVGADVLAGRFDTTSALLHAIIAAVAEPSLLARPAPKFLRDSDHECPRLVLLPEATIRTVDWVPGIQVTQANPQERLPQPFWQIDIPRLEAELTSEQRQQPFAQVLLAVGRRALDENTALRRNMVPAWLREGAPELSAAVDRSCFIPDRREAVGVSPLPQSSEWWAHADFSNLRAVLSYGQAIVTDRGITRGEKVGGADPSARMALLRTVEPFGDRWAYRDRPAEMLDTRGGWRGFRTVKVPKTLKSAPQPSVAMAVRPVLATRQYPALFPGSMDQASYWRGVIEAFSEIKGSGAVPILLVSSTANSDLLYMLATACAEVGIGESRPAHRSRREHLRRARERGLAIVESLDNWREWLALAEESGISLQPVVEAFPVEEWFALADAVACEGTQVADEGETTVASEASTMSEGAILEALPKLVERFLGPWLEDTGLAHAPRPVTVLDARADLISQQVRAFVDRQPLAGSPWSISDRLRLDTVFSALEIKREAAPSDGATMEQFLVANWQPPSSSDGNTVSGFKPTQKLAMEPICARTSDVMVALPTGEGKSVLFQVPALCRGLRNRRLTLVVSPLKALMRDQVTRLHEQGFADSVDYISSDRPRFELAEVLQGVLDHRIVLLYVAPERLRNAVFLDVLRRRIESDAGLEYVAFDEAHCVNQWGYEFRPDYFHAFNFLMKDLRGGDRLDATPFILLSATLTASDRRSVRSLLEVGAQGNAKLPLTICPDPETISNPLRSHIEVEPMQVQGNILDSQDFETALAERLPHILQVIHKAKSNHRETGQRSAIIIFVTRRAHADDLARRLTEAAASDVESYHAGLDAATREDIYTRFRDGDLDVLVATKAFGMGMDIPDIHWVVHLSPPAYLEDYLQEVGRIGRGVVERKRAGLEKLSAVMLASPIDFENMRGLRAMNELRVPQIDEIEREIINVADTIEGQKVAFVPQHGFEPYKSAAQMRANATRLRMALYWLEKSGHLVQLGMVPDLLSVELYPKQLAEIANEQSQQGEVAKAILSLAAGGDSDAAHLGAYTSRPDGGGLFGGILNWLSGMIGVRVDTPQRATSSSASARTQSVAVINLSQVRRRCRISSMDETMACLVDLQRRRGLNLLWKLEFAKRPLLSEPPKRIEALISTIGRGVRELIRQTGSNGTIQFNPFNWLDEDDWGLADPDEPSPRTRKEEAEQLTLRRRYQRAYLHGFRSLARASGIRLKQLVHDNDQHVFWQAEMPKASSWAVKARCEKLLVFAPDLLSNFTKAKDAELRAVDVHTLIGNMQEANPQTQFRISDLEAVLRFLSALNLVSAQPDLVPLSYVLLLTDFPAGFAQHPELIEELNSVNELAETRTFAMEVFASLPERARGAFIGGYFTQASAAALKEFLDTQLGEIEDDGEEAKGFIASKRDQLRATRATEFFARYQQSEETAQWEAICHQFDRHLLVNAGPGAGKTSVLVGRIAHLIREQHVKPSEIMVLAFNRAVVFEIRKRIRDLFRSLGYAAYASQVRVSTFHALARRSLAVAERQDEAATRENLLEVFEAKLSSDASFREQVAGGCRSLLIDEYQDVTEDVYSIIRSLYRGSGERAGVMAIGDDDQDILRWQRKAGSFRGGEFAETYFQRFGNDFGGDDLASLELCVNFRSGSDIVQMSQNMISGFFARDIKSKRLKKTLLREALGAVDSRCERIVSRGRSWDETIEQVTDACVRLCTENPGSLAVLCRSNEEVASIYRHLAIHFPGLTVQSSENMRIADLRHVGLWIDFLEVEMARQDRALSEPLRRDLIRAFFQSVAIPEAVSPAESEFDLSVLWELCCEESVFPHLSTLVRFLKSLQRDELQRLLGGRKGDAEAVVSTIHKVKGLEFDNVVVVPSRSRFGGGSGSGSAMESDAAEEARLLYVALTRAKSRLVYFVGERESAWGRSPPHPYEGEPRQGKILTGAHEQVDLGWAMRRTSFNANPDECQAYIELNVSVGDRIVLGGAGARANMSLFHSSASGEKRQVGSIARKFGAGNDADLKVSAVIRYRVDERSPEVTGKLVSDRGWAYVVLVAGRLR